MKEYTNKPKEQSSFAPPVVQLQTRPFAPPQVQQSPSPQTTESSQAEQDLESKKQQSSQPTLYAPNPIFSGNGDHNSTKNVMQRKWEGIVQRVKEGRITEHDPSHTYTPMSGSPENVMQRKGLEIAQRLKENRTKQHQEKIQAKLAIGAVGDKYEQEADRVASQVVQKINAPESVQREPKEEHELQMKPEISPLQREPEEEEEDLQMKPLSIQREPDEEEEELQMKPEISSIQRDTMPEEDEELQAKSLVQRRDTYDGGEASADLESSIQQAKGGGQALDRNLQAKMGEAMGADFSGVKVHTDSQSDQLNQSIQAKAFTTGQDVFFRQGAYNPSSKDGQELIAHELTHVVQQNGGAVQRSLGHLGQLQQKRLPFEMSKDSQALVQRKFAGELQEVGSSYTYLKALLIKHTVEGYELKFSEYRVLNNDKTEYKTIKSVVEKLGKTYTASPEPKVEKQENPTQELVGASIAAPTEKAQTIKPTEIIKPIKTTKPTEMSVKGETPPSLSSTKPKAGSLTVDNPPLMNEPVTNKPVFKSPPEFIPVTLNGTKYRVKAGQNYLNTDLSQQYMQDASSIKGSEVTLMLPTLNKIGEREADVRVVADGHHRFVWGSFHGEPVPARDTGRPFSPQDWQPMKYQGSPKNLPTKLPTVTTPTIKVTDGKKKVEKPKATEEKPKKWPSMGRIETPVWSEIEPLLSAYGVVKSEEIQAMKEKLAKIDLEKEPIRGINDLIGRALGNERYNETAKFIKGESAKAAESVSQGPVLEMGRGDERSPSEINAGGGFFAWDAGIVTLEHAKQIMMKVTQMSLSEQRKWVASWKWPTPAPEERNPWVATGIGGSQKGTYKYEFKIPLQAHKRVGGSVMIPMTDTGDLSTATIIGVKLLVGPTGDEVLMLTGVPKEFIVACNDTPLEEEQWTTWNKAMGTRYKKV